MHSAFGINRIVLSSNLNRVSLIQPAERGRTGARGGAVCDVGILIAPTVLAALADGHASRRRNRCGHRHWRRHWRRCLVCLHATLDDTVGLRAIIDSREDALRLGGVGLVEEVEATLGNHTVGHLEPSSNRAPTIGRCLEEVLPHRISFPNKVIAWPEAVHVLRIDGPVAGDHVDEPCASITGLVHRGVVAGLVCNLRQELLDGLGVIALVDNGVCQHFVELIGPLLRAIIPKLIAAGSLWVLGLARAALWPIA